MDQGFAKRASTVQFVSRFMSFPTWARVAAVVAALVVVLGAVSIPVAINENGSSASYYWGL